jgi:hypothetical protein
MHQINAMRNYSSRVTGTPSTTPAGARAAPIAGLPIAPPRQGRDRQRTRSESPPVILTASRLRSGIGAVGFIDNRLQEIDPDASNIPLTSRQRQIRTNALSGSSNDPGQVSSSTNETTESRQKQAEDQRRDLPIDNRVEELAEERPQNQAVNRGDNSAANQHLNPADDPPREPLNNNPPPPPANEDPAADPPRDPVDDLSRQRNDNNAETAFRNELLAWMKRSDERFESVQQQINRLAPQIDRAIATTTSSVSVGR